MRIGLTCTESELRSAKLDIQQELDYIKNQILSWELRKSHFESEIAAINRALAENGISTPDRKPWTVDI